MISNVNSKNDWIGSGYFTCGLFWYTMVELYWSKTVPQFSLHGNQVNTYLSTYWETYSCRSVLLDAKQKNKNKNKINNKRVSEKKTKKKEEKNPKGAQHFENIIQKHSLGRGSVSFVLIIYLIFRILFLFFSSLWGALLLPLESTGKIGDG